MIHKRSIISTLLEFTVKQGRLTKQNFNYNSVKKYKGKILSTMAVCDCWVLPCLGQLHAEKFSQGNCVEEFNFPHVSVFLVMPH